MSGSFVDGDFESAFQDLKQSLGETQDIIGQGQGDQSDEQDLQNVTLSSSAIANVSFRKSTGEMTITFTDGKSYVMSSPVPEIEFSRLIQADSPGGYWNANMRGRY